TQGLGVVAIGLALFAVMAGILVERRPSPEAEAPRTTDHRSPITDYRPVVMFWAVAAVVALVFAWGRYLDMSPHGASGFGPYRLFYMLPKMDAMRNPLKFLYPMMLSVAVLAAFGMQYLSQQPAKQGKSGARRTR
ncbi:hypothetical protein GX586_11935, partial [bacterium]|nr:hypothetical protein [bacterium]